MQVGRKWHYLLKQVLVTPLVLRVTVGFHSVQVPPEGLRKMSEKRRK